MLPGARAAVGIVRGRRARSTVGLQCHPLYAGSLLGASMVVVGGMRRHGLGAEGIGSEKEFDVFDLPS